MGVNASQKALGGRLLITSGSINLTGQKEVFNHSGAQRIVQETRVEIVIFNGIGRLENNRVFKALYRVQRLQLNLQR